MSLWTRIDRFYRGGFNQMSKSWGRDFDTISVDTRAEGSHFGLHSTSVYHIDHIGLEKLLSCGIFHYVTRNVKHSWYFKISVYIVLWSNCTTFLHQCLFCLKTFFFFWYCRTGGSAWARKDCQFDHCGKWSLHWHQPRCPPNVSSTGCQIPYAYSQLQHSLVKY